MNASTVKRSQSKYYSCVTNGFDNPRTEYGESAVDVSEFRFNSERPNVDAITRKWLFWRSTQAPISVWVDGRVQVLSEFPCEDLLAGKDLAVFSHPWRDCVYTEAAANIVANRTNPADVVRHTLNLDIPDKVGMVATGILIRRDTPECREFCKAVVASMRRSKVWRDQLHFNVVSHRLDFEYSVIPGNVFGNEWNTVHQHEPGYLAGLKK